MYTIQKHSMLWLLNSLSCFLSHGTCRGTISQRWQIIVGKWSWFSIKDAVVLVAAFKQFGGVIHPFGVWNDPISCADMYSASRLWDVAIQSRTMDEKKCIVHCLPVTLNSTISVPWMYWFSHSGIRQSKMHVCVHVCNLAISEVDQTVAHPLLGVHPLRPSANFQPHHTISPWWRRH